MKAIESPVPVDPPPVVFRIGPAAAMFLALLVTLVGYVPLRAFSITSYPFGVAALIGLAGFLLMMLASRTTGIECSSAGLRDLRRKSFIAWDDIEQIQVEVLPPDGGTRRLPARAVTLAAKDGRRLSFVEAGGLTPKEQAQYEPVVHAPFLLALIAHRLQARDLFPSTWIDPPPDPQEAAASTPVPLSVRLKNAWGLFPLLLKLLKSVKPLWLLGSVGVYSLVFSWQFAVVLVVLIGFHECGHVFAMYRCGIPVKGIYLIPFFGGAAVSKGIARTRREEAYIAANGPVWGTLLVFACFAVYHLTGDRFPVLAAAGAWGAFINLFNLLPIMPLDGGRLLNDLAYSIGAGAGNLLVALSLLAGGAYAYFQGLELLVLMVLIGLLEYAGHCSAIPIGRALAGLRGRRMQFEEFRHFEAFVTTPKPGAADASSLDASRAAFDARMRQASLQPMNWRESLLVVTVYAGLVVALLGALYLTRDLPGHADPLDLLV